MRQCQDNERLYLRGFEGIDTSFVGEFVGSGAGHNVYEYGNDQVVKVPKRRHFSLGASADDQVRDICVQREHFQQWVLSTLVLTKDHGSKYCILQEKVDARNFTNAETKEADNAFSLILEENRKLVRDAGISLDFLGMDGLLSCYRAILGKTYGVEMSNVMIERSSGRVVLPDPTLLRLQYPRSFIRERLLRKTFVANRDLIKRFWGDDIAG